MNTFPRGREVYILSPWTWAILGNSWPKEHRGSDTKWFPSAGHKRWYSFCLILLRLHFRALIHLPGEKSQAATLHRSHHCRHFADCPSWGATGYTSKYRRLQIVSHSKPLSHPQLWIFPTEDPDIMKHKNTVHIKPYSNSWFTESWIGHASWTEIMQGTVGGARITESDVPALSFNYLCHSIKICVTLGNLLMCSEGQIYNM